MAARSIQKDFKKLTGRFFGDMDFTSVFVTVVGCAAMILYLYHGRPEHFVETFPRWAKSLPPVRAELYSYLYSHVAAFSFLLLIPLVLSWLFLKKSPRDHGFRFRTASREFKIVLVLFLLFLPVVFILSRTAGFSENYPKLGIIRDSFSLFMLYQGAYLVKWVAWEYFFRGFLLFGYKERFGDSAILISTLPFVIIHWGKPEPEIFASIAAGLILGRLALSGKSFLPGTLLHFLIAASMDFATSTFWR